MTPDPDHDDPLEHGDVMSNNVTPWIIPSLTRLFYRRFGSKARGTAKATDADSMHMDGSGHLDIGFGGASEVYLHLAEGELRIVIEAVSGEHEASMSAVLDADGARELGEELVHQSNQLDESD